MNVVEINKHGFIFEVNYGLNINNHGLRVSIPLIPCNLKGMKDNAEHFYATLMSIVSNIPLLEAIYYFDGFDYFFCQGHSLSKAISFRSHGSINDLIIKAQLVKENCDPQSISAVNAKLFLDEVNKYD